jgi:hypothetical protein
MRSLSSQFAAAAAAPHLPTNYCFCGFFFATAGKREKDCVHDFLPKNQ